jgi:hypothetical protein
MDPITTPEIRALQEHYNRLKEELKTHPLFIAKEAAGAAMNAAILREKAERVAARVAAAVKPWPGTSPKPGEDTVTPVVNDEMLSQ